MFEVWGRIHLLQEEIEQLRYIMGKPKRLGFADKIEDASTYEILFQAQSLYKRADALAYQFVRERGDEIEKPSQPVSYAHIAAILEDSISRLRLVKVRLNIESPNRYVQGDMKGTDSELFREIINANRQLDLLLNQSFSPSDVFQQVTQAISYGASILAEHPQAARIPEAPPYEEGKQPKDVFNALLTCYDLVKQVTRDKGIKILDWKHVYVEGEEIYPGDAYNLATLIVSELALVHGHLGSEHKPRAVFYPGNKFPSDVYQRVGILRKQIEEAGFAFITSS
jgi:hypothetical protein